MSENIVLGEKEAVEKEFGLKRYTLGEWLEMEEIDVKMEYTKESLLNDLECKSQDILELKKGIDWIVKYYRLGKLPD